MKKEFFSKIGINGERLLIKEPAGPENYIYNIINALAKIDSANEYTIYLTKNPESDYFNKLTNANSKFKFKVIKSSLSWTQSGLALELHKNPVDIFFTAVHTMPIFHSKKTKFVAMIHGLEYKYQKGNEFLLEGPTRYTVKHSDLVIVPSDFTLAEILNKKWKVSPDKIKVVPEGVGENFYKRHSLEIAPILDKYRLKTRNYLLYVSTIQPRKNLPKLIEAFSLIVKKDPTLKLAVSGKLGWGYEESLAAPRKFGIEDNVIFLQRTTDEDLPALFSGALMYVSTSFEEGFGLTLLEAMACETPCLVSDIPSFKALGENLVSYVDPNAVSSIKIGIEQLTQNYPTIEFLQKAAEHAKNYTWEKTAKATLDFIQGLH
ncbi:MAG TPA: glycosyltransferase family 1 protein [Candidatus Saccharimonadales bacterium]|nr:glycosyltransferase family 1 protein [Candidatus Saccharimonadales bacterium]